MCARACVCRVCLFVRACALCCVFVCVCVCVWKVTKNHCRERYDINERPGSSAAQFACFLRRTARAQSVPTVHDRARLCQLYSSFRNCPNKSWLVLKQSLTMDITLLYDNRPELHANRADWGQTCTEWRHLPEEVHALCKLSNVNTSVVVYL